MAIAGTRGATPQERYEVLLNVCRKGVTGVYDENLREVLAETQAELTRLNDRYMSLLHDESENNRRMRAVLARDVLFNAERSARAAVSRLLFRSSGSYLMKCMALVDVAKPKASDVQSFRVALHAWIAIINDAQRRGDVAQEAVDETLGQFQASAYHADVLKWQDMVAEDLAKREGQES